MEYYNVIGKLGKPMTIEDIFIIMENLKITDMQKDHLHC